MPSNGYKQTEEHKRKIRKALRGKKYKPMSKWGRKNISEAMKGEKNPFFGKHHTPEANKKNSKAHKGRKQSEETIRKRIKRGKEHYNWQGGKSFEPYGLEFNDDLKGVIRNRDRRKCFICGKAELENKEKLVVHHIDYNKKNNNPNNLISLCRGCHTKTNYNRCYWIKYFKSNIIS